MANATSRRGWSPATGNATKRAKRPTELLGGVVEAALQHVHQIGLKAINQPVLPADAARPEAGKIVFEGFGLARAGGGGAQALFEQRPNLAGDGLIRVKPVLKVLPGGIVGLG